MSRERVLESDGVAVGRRGDEVLACVGSGGGLRSGAGEAVDAGGPALGRAVVLCPYCHMGFSDAGRYPRR